MNIETAAFHEIIKQANRAHKCFNEVGPDAAAFALAELVEQCHTMMHHLDNMPKPGVAHDPR